MGRCLQSGFEARGLINAETRQPNSPRLPRIRFIVSVLTIAFCLNISQLTGNSSLASCLLMVEMIRKET
jgi:hypothetical protein